MDIGKVNNGYTFGYALPFIDTEEKEIMQKLLAYGVTPTGNKSADRAKLHEIEHEKAKQENTVSSNKFLAVSSTEQEHIQEKKKEHKKMSGIGADTISDYNKAFLVKGVRGK